MKTAEGLEVHCDGLVAETRRKEAEREAELQKLGQVERVVTMQAAHHLKVDELKLQLKLRSTIDKLKLDTKAITIGGSREELLLRLKACMLLVDEHTADGYDVKASKSFYIKGGGTGAAQPAAADVEMEEEEEGGVQEAEAEAEVEAEAAEVGAAPLTATLIDGCAVDRVEMAEERAGETFYLLKWRGLDEAQSSWVATSELIEYGVAVVELVARFESSHVDDDDEEELAEGEYVVEKLIDRRYSPTSCKLEYMVRWKGYGAEEDGWEEAEGLPLDLRAAYDASLRTSTRPQRGRG